MELHVAKHENHMPPDEPQRECEHVQCNAGQSVEDTSHMVPEPNRCKEEVCSWNDIVVDDGTFQQ